MNQVFDRIVQIVGHPLVIPALLMGIVVLYTLSGVEVTNFSISVLTLLLLPILQHSQNRDGLALQAKLDELIRVTEAARNDLIGADKKTQEEIEALR